jgi:stage V sporulation protein B
MFFGAETITRWMNTPDTAASVRALAPAALFVCCMSAFRGYFQGHGNMIPTSVSQVMEASCKLVVGLALAYMLAKQSLALASAGAILGVTTGTAVSLIFLATTFLRQREKSPSEDVPDSSSKILRTLVAIAIPITIGSSVTNIVYLLDNGIILSQLKNVLGMTQEQADAMYGNYGAVSSLYSLPSSLMIPFTASILPAVAACRSRRDHLGASRVAESAMRVGMLIALPAGLGLSVLAHPITAMLYPGYDNDIAGGCLTWLGLASIFVCIMLLSNSILQANGMVNLPVIIAAIGGALKLSINYVLVGIESINVVGAAIGTLVCFAVVAALDLTVIHRTVPSPPRIRRIFAKPLLASLVMAACAWAVNGLMSRVLVSLPAFQSLDESGAVQGLSRTGNAIATLGAIAVAGVVYLVLIVVLKAISKEDLSLMPKGDKLGKLLHLD